MALLGAQPVVDVENVIIVLVVVAVVMSGLAGLCEDAAGVVSGFVSELGVADVIGFDEIGGQLAEGLIKSEDMEGQRWKGKQTER